MNPSGSVTGFSVAYFTMGTQFLIEDDRRNQNMGSAALARRLCGLVSRLSVVYLAQVKEFRDPSGCGR
jgi:hypothetical protein